MDYGLLVPTYIDMWKEVVRAEEAGFTHAWFPDSQLIWSDCYAAMALAAERTSTIKLGTLVSIPSNRIAPVTASAIATINKLAPGRTILALGTGYTGRNTMGLPSYPVKKFREYAQQVRDLLDGNDILHTDDVTGRETWIRLIHPDHPDFYNIKDHIPVYIAANGPRATAVVGEVGDGFVTSGAGPWLDTAFPIIEESAQAAGRPTEKPYTVSLTGACILNEGEELRSDRVVHRAGAVAAVYNHTLWESEYGGWGGNLKGANPDLAAEYNQYITQYATERGRPLDRLYLDVHEGHYSYLKDGEARFVTEDRLNDMMIGRPNQFIEKAEDAAAHGVDHFALTALDPSAANDLIDEMAPIIARTAG